MASAYLAAKAGAWHFMHSIALELAADGITVNAIAPGFFATNIGEGRELDPDVQAGAGNVIPLRRIGRRDATGLAAWLGGVAFCVGFRISAPVWVALVLTVLNLAISTVSAVLKRRGRRTVPAAAS